MRIRTFLFSLHVRKVVAQRGNPFVRKFLGHRSHERVMHASSCSVRKNVERMRLTRDHENSINITGGCRDAE